MEGLSMSYVYLNSPSVVKVVSRCVNPATNSYQTNVYPYILYYMFHVNTF
jgi:hypothetical protein